MKATTRNGKNVYILEFKKGDQIDVSLYAVGKLLLATNEGKRCIRVFER